MIYTQWPSLAAFMLLTASLAGSALGAGQHGGDSSASSHDSKAGAIKISERIVIDAAPETVWNTVRDFDAISVWHPGVVASKITSGKNNRPGAKRHLSLEGGGGVDEQLIAWNDAKKRYTYRILGGDLPVSNYRSTIAVKTKGGNESTLIWEGEFDPAKGHSKASARKAIRGVYRAGLVNVKALLGAAAHQ